MYAGGTAKAVPPALSGFVTSQSYIYSVVAHISGITLYHEEHLFANIFSGGFQHIENIKITD